MKSIIVAMAMLFVLAFNSKADAQVIVNVTRNNVSTGWRGPSYPYTWGPYGNYGYNPYVGSAGYQYRYQQYGTIYPTPVWGRYPVYNSRLYIQFGRVR
jgi:hypothetical protein